MKKILAILLALAMILSFAACGSEKQPEKQEEPQKQEEQKEPEKQEEPEAELPEIKDITEKVTFQDFKFTVNGKELKNADLAGLHIYKIKTTSTNSKGVTSEITYGGYKLGDVLDLCGLKDVKNVKVVASDGYESTLAGEYIYSDYTLLAIEKDKAQSEDGTIWLAPCESTVGNVYCKLVVGIVAE